MAVAPPRSFRTRLVSRATKSPTIAFPKPGRRIGSNGRGSSVIGCGPRRDFWRDRAPSLPSPWSADDNGACFIVKDHNGQALAYVYYEEDWQKGSGQSSDKRRGKKDRHQHCKSAGVATALKARFA